MDRGNEAYPTITVRVKEHLADSEADSESDHRSAASEISTRPVLRHPTASALNLLCAIYPEHLFKSLILYNLSIPGDKNLAPALRDLLLDGN